MFQNRSESLYVCKNCGEGFRVKNLERHVKEAHFWDKKLDYFRK